MNCKDIDNNWLHLYPMIELRKAATWFPVQLSKANGSFYYDNEDNQFFDMLSGAFCCNFGHCRKDFIDAWVNASSKISFTSPFSHINEYQAELSMRLSSHFLDNYGGKWCVFYVNSGSEAIECSLNIIDGYNTRTQSIRKIFATVKGAYHGTTLGAKHVSSFDGIEYNRILKSPNVAYLNGVSHFDSSHTAENIVSDFRKSLREQFSGKYGLEDISAVVVETVENCAGNYPMTSEYVDAIQFLQNEYGVKVVADEVITGMGRLGDITSAKQFSLLPDITVFGKGLTGAHESLGAVVVRTDIAQQFHGDDDCLQHGATFGGRPASCAIALKVLETLNQKGFQSRYTENEMILKEFIKRISNKECVSEITGKGMLWTIHLLHKKKNMEDLHRFFIKKGIVSCIYPERIWPRIEIAPPLTTDPSDLEDVLQTYLEGI